MKYLKIIVVLLGYIAVASSCNSQLTAEQQEIINQTKANFIFVKGGTFIMGKAPIPKSMPEHEVTLDSYSMSKYETTWKDYDLYTELSGQEKLREDYRDLKDYAPNYGVKAISWQMARTYCQWLGQQLELPMDLPTEAQWEYAARSRGLDVAHATDSGKIEGNYTQKRNYIGSKVAV